MLGLLRHAQEKSIIDTRTVQGVSRTDWYFKTAAQGGCMNLVSLGQVVDCSDPTFGQGGLFPTDFAAKGFYQAKGVGPVDCKVKDGTTFRDAYVFDHFNDPRIEANVANYDRTAFFGTLRKSGWDILSNNKWPASGSCPVRTPYPGSPFAIPG